MNEFQDKGFSNKMIEKGHFFDVFVTPFKRALTQKQKQNTLKSCQSTQNKKQGDNSYTYG